ncbi:hypothetical protein MTQ01_13020 [Streptomyces sp. XM4193]|uniref:type II toxin-antitoxin system RelE family toxin n=1 Tax=Streptomyces sp. XM4193 TaxID=2929782 RepID=UPI001FFB455C|nr:hypothetical protein [Streptomyces sp. XM4193]MCK1796919.1 hypothetical protein [Streptomyces sp. XM4193]
MRPVRVRPDTPTRPQVPAGHTTDLQTGAVPGNRRSPASPSSAVPIGRERDPRTWQRVHKGAYREDADVKKLTGPSWLYRLRVGNHRIAHRIDDGELVVLVVELAGRRDVGRSR